jgi:arabinose-5-phosphate isomerase
MTAAVAAARAETDRPSDPGDLAVARDVLLTEAAGLHALAAGLDHSFGHAVDLLARATGRVAVSGMGKSGHVARKIAATLASTGTPALFVHPAEASHGDLGMIVPGDAVLALSNSGETVELADLVAHSRRFGLPLVAITAHAGSALATTMQMALGDALAVALLTRRGFTEADFHQFHPGGRLGTRLRRVRDVMHTGEAVPLAPPDTVMDRALLLITEKRFGCLGVVDAAGRLTGIVTDGDLRRAMGPDLLSRRVADVMTRSPRTIMPDALAVEALHAMNARERPITTLFVVDASDRPLGILHIHDLLRAGIA